MPGKVRGLEADIGGWRAKIWEHREKRGPQVRDWGHHFKTVEDLRARIFASSVDSALIPLQMDTARCAADEFRVKYETELAMRQSVGSDISGLRRSLMTPVSLGCSWRRRPRLSGGAALRKEPRGGSEVCGARLPSWGDRGIGCLQIPGAWGIWAQCEELAQENREELDTHWSQQTEERSTVATSQTTETGATEMTQTHARSLETSLDLVRNLQARLESSLREAQMRCARRAEQLSRAVLHWSRSRPSPGQRGSTRPRSTGPAEHQGQAGGRDHHLPSPAGRRGRLRSR